MKKRTLLAWCFAEIAALCFALFTPPLLADSYHQLARDFEQHFEHRVKEESLPGAAFVIATSSGIVHIATVGHVDTRRNQRINADTTFRVASVSKTFAAGLAGLLVNEGAFDWNDPVTRYVPDFRIKGDASKMQIEHLLGQSTGLIPHAYDNLIEDGLPMARIQDQFRTLEYLCSPGTCYSYQNSIFSMIEPVMQKTTQKDYSRLMAEKIFQPLGMASASVGYQPLIENPNHARPHVKRKGRWTTVSVKPNYYRVAPAAGVNASITDMGQWLRAHLGAFPDVMDTDLVTTLTRPRVETRRDRRRKHWRDVLSDAHYGLGWRVYSLGAQDIAYHSGWVSGYRADVAFSSDRDIGIAVLLNSEGSTISELTTQFWQMAFAQTEEKPPKRSLVTPVAAHKD